MSKRTWIWSVTALALVGCSGTSKPAPSGNNDSNTDIARSQIASVPAGAVPAAELTAAAAANNAFAVDLYAQVLKTEPSGNLLTSPITATLALTMSYAGAREQTASEMAQVLHLSGGDADFAGQNALSQALATRGSDALAQARTVAQQNQHEAPSADDYQFQLVNSVWGQTGYPWQQPFLDTLATNYGTGVYQLDFKTNPTAARSSINDWVSDQTSAKISDLLPPDAIDDETRMVLINALHLKLPWAAPFSADLTHPAPFVRGDASTVQADFMSQLGEDSYIDDGQAQIIALPLAHADLWVVIALPHEGVSLAAYEATLGANSAALHRPSGSALIDLLLPKTTFTSKTFSLRTALKALGMNQAFDPDAANFKGLCANPPPPDKNLSVSDVLQKTMLSMQENGAEAAAATAVIMGVGSSAPTTPPPTPIPMDVNRPYLVAFVDAPTDTVLMLGHIQDPTDAGQP